VEMILRKLQAPEMHQVLEATSNEQGDGSMAAANKCLAKSDKSEVGGKATKKRETQQHSLMED
jgi:hypothetical protein